MRVLFDVNVPRQLRAFLIEHQVVLAAEIGWRLLKNGELLSAAESEGFEVMITADQNIRYQQNLPARRISVVVLGSNLWPYVRQCLREIAASVDLARPGGHAFIAVALPPKPKRLRP